MGIDWKKPLELEDGTPVRLRKGKQPDVDGDYAIGDENGKFIGFWKPDGSRWGWPDDLHIRNRRPRSIPWQKLLWLTVFGSLIISGGWMLGTHIDGGASAGFIVTDILVLIAASGAFALTLFGED